MQWLEIAADAADTEALCAFLEEIGVSGLVIEDEKDIREFIEANREFWDEVDEDFRKAREGVSRVKFYLSDDADGRAEWERLRPLMEKAGYVPQVGRLRDEDWENNWKQYYKPIEVGKRLLIVPEWEETPENEGRTVLRLNPGLIFGTGAHPSTRMCLEAMETLAPNTEKVLDLGCGSGILAIAALCLGAKTALGCDIDEKAPAIAAENAELNGVSERLTVLAGDATSDAALRARMGKREYGIVFLNIVADVIIRLCRDVPEWIAPDGTLIVSGVIDGREAEVQSALEQAGFRVTGHRRLGDWHSFVCIPGGETK